MAPRFAAFGDTVPLIAILALTGCGNAVMFGNATFAEVWFSRDGKTALTAGGYVTEGPAKFWDVATGRLLRTVTLPAEPANDDAHWLVSRDLDFVVTHRAVWDLTTGALRRRLDTTYAITRVIALAPNDSAAYALTADSIVAFDLATGARTAAAPRPGAGPNAIFDHTELSADGRWLAFFAGRRMQGDGAVYLAELPALRVEPAAYQPPYPNDPQGRGPQTGGAWTQGMKFSPDKHTLAISDGFEKVTLYDVPERRMLRQLRCEFRVHMRMAIPMGFSHDGSRLVVHEGPEYPGLCLFEVPTGRLVRSIPEPRDYDRRLMITVGADRIVAWRRGLGPFQIYDLASGNELRTFCPIPAGCLTGGGPQARIVGLSPDGRSLFASDQKQINGVWDIESGRLRAWLAVPERPRPWESAWARLMTALRRWM
jgi:hypothetical protein